MQSLGTVAPALRAAGYVGTWCTNVGAGSTVLDEGAATQLAGSPDLAGQPIPLEVALGRIHPGDLAWVFERIRRVRSTGGPFSAEFRILTPTNDVRWILDRGTLTRDSAGVMQGLGVYIDTTDSHSTTGIPAAALKQAEEDPLIRAADHCLDAHAALKSGGYPNLLRMSETLLFSIGRAIAGRWD